MTKFVITGIIILVKYKRKVQNLAKHGKPCDAKLSGPKILVMAASCNQCKHQS